VHKERKSKLVEKPKNNLKEGSTIMVRSSMSKKWIRIIAVSVIVIFAAVMAGCGGGSKAPAAGEKKAEEVKLKAEYKLTMNVAAQTKWGEGAMKFAELAKEYTKGKVNIKVYPNAMLTGGDQMRQTEMVQNGSIDFMVNSTINIAPTVQEFDVWGLPFMFDDYKAVDAVMNSSAPDRLFKALDKYNMVGLAWGENSFREVTNNKRPIASPDDMKGIKMRVVTPLYIDIMRALGANAVSMNWGEVFTSLQQGVIDGQENPIVGIIIPNKVYEVQKHLTNWHYSYDALAVVSNKATWNSFPPEIKEQLQKAAKDSMKWQVGESRKSLTEGIGFLKQKGMTVTDLTPEQIAKFRELTKPVYEKYAQKVGKDVAKSFEDEAAKAKK
jgi:tripartite ATP-independent transporter DctP family solute receptor